MGAESIKRSSTPKETDVVVSFKQHSIVNQMEVDRLKSHNMVSLISLFHYMWFSL